MFQKFIFTALRVSVVFCALYSLQSAASVVVNGTRVVYPGDEKEVTVKVSNVGKNPVLIQSWVDKGDVDDKPEKIQVPFILTPPIGRIDPSKSQTLRLSYTASPALPEDRESVYWLNVLEIPSVTKNMAPNHLQIAFRTRIKLFYRPASIADKTQASEAAKTLRWSYSANTLTARNDSPYFVSLASVAIKEGSKKNVVDGEMVPPKGSQTFAVKGSVSLHPGIGLSYEYIDDWGAVQTVDSHL